MRKPKQPAPKENPLNDPSVKAVLKSEVFQIIIAKLESEDTRHVGLKTEANLEQRALKQALDQGYSTCLNKIKNLAFEEKQKTLPTTYQQ